MTGLELTHKCSTRATLLQRPTIFQQEMPPAGPPLHSGGPQKLYQLAGVGVHQLRAPVDAILNSFEIAQVVILDNDRSSSILKNNRSLWRPVSVSYVGNTWCTRHDGKAETALRSAECAGLTTRILHNSLLQV